MRVARAWWTRHRFRPRAFAVADAGGPSVARGGDTGWAEREAVLLRLEAEDGTSGWGEAAPLPGYSPDTLRDVDADLALVPLLDDADDLRLRATRSPEGATIVDAGIAAAGGLEAGRRMQAELQRIGLDEEALQADFQSWRQQKGAGLQN